jgi:tetratricopeptide (TPR) repeat protein
MNTGSFDPEGDHRRRAAQDLFMMGRAFVKSGDRAQARQLLKQAVDKDPDHDQAWLWLSAATDDPAEQKQYLEWAVAANPANAQARRGLAILTGKLNPKDIAPSSGAPQSPPSSEPMAAAVQRTFTCPKCGGRMRFEPEISDLRCENCGHVEVVEDKPVTPPDRVLDFTLPTRTGHRWAEAERRMTCNQCGAKTIFPPGQTSMQCPFCGNAAFAAAAEDAELLAPQALIPMGFAAAQVQKAVRAWLGAGFFAPDDLTLEALSRGLRSAYVPFWLFSATQTAHWRAMVQQGYGRDARWVWIEGEHIFFYTDQLQPGARALPADLIRKLEPFDLGKLIEYKSEYLAGWPAASYDLSLAQATTNAHAVMIADAKQQLFSKAAPGQTKRDFDVSRSDFTGETYKIVLLPVWMGAYRYRGRDFRVLINGQSGKVAGDKPRDWIKVALVVVGAALLLGLLVLIATFVFSPR